MNEEEVWKRRLHEAWTTPRQILDAAVERATGAVTTGRSRILGGEGNEVWSVTTSRDDDLIVRVSHRGVSFSAEHWAAQRSLEKGVPAPDVLLVEDSVAIDSTRQVALWIHQRRPGESLHHFDGKAASDLTAEAGEMLARIHSVSTAGYGYIDSAGRATSDTFAEFLGWNGEASGAVLANGVREEDLTEAAGLISNSDWLWSSPQLLHGDWLPEHVLADGDHVSAVIDFGGTCSGDPAYDFAYWSFFRGFDDADEVDHWPLSALIQGYRRLRDPGPDLDGRISLCLVSKAVKHMALYLSHGRTAPAEHCRQRFLHGLSRARDQ